MHREKRHVIVSSSINIHSYITVRQVISITFSIHVDFPMMMFETTARLLRINLLRTNDILNEALVHKDADAVRRLRKMYKKLRFTVS